MDIEINLIQLCKYCKERKVIRTYGVTCGDFKCQYKHHILFMRNKRKTKQVRTTKNNIEKI